MNPILQMIGGMGGNNGRSLMLQAFAAMMRGESPEAFMQGLANRVPELQGLDLANLEQTAHALSAKKGVNEGQLIQQIQTEAAAQK